MTIEKDGQDNLQCNSTMGDLLTTLPAYLENTNGIRPRPRLG
jgi:hypothetical protein